MKYRNLIRPWRPSSINAPQPVERSAQMSDRNNLGSVIQTPQVIRIACNNKVFPLPGNDHHRGVDNVLRVGGGAEFSTGTGQMLVKRDNFHFLAPQEPR